MNKTEGPKLRILYVEDNMHDRVVFRRAFKDSRIPCDITEFERAEKALERLQTDESSFDIIITDHGLPGMSGLEFCKELIKRKTSLPLVILTGTGSEKIAIEALKAGVYDYVIKDDYAGYLELLPFALVAVVNKHNERLLRIKAEEQNKAILQTALDGFCILDTQGQLLEVNDAYISLIGYSREELLKMNVSDVEALEKPKDIEERIQRIIKNGNDRFESKHKCKDGRTIDVDVSVNYLNINEGLFFSFIRDITKRKQTEEDLKKAKEMAETANKAKSEFLASMSHETRTPMNAIIGIADLLNDTDLTKEQKEYVNIFKNASENLLQLINNILDISKIESGHLKLEQIDFDLRELVEKTCETLAVCAHGKGLEIIHHIKADIPTKLIGDPNRLRQIFLNLVSNSIKFTKKGDIVVRVENHDTANEYPTILFSVSDTGIGIPDDKIKTVFEIFTQADSSTTRKYGGTGLGLSISKQLVERMDGRIWAENNESGGSTFFFKIKFKRQEEQERRKKIYERTLDLKGLNVLTIDDNATNRMILRETLKTWGALVTDAEDGKRALAIIDESKRNNKPFDLIILDSRMTEMDGYKVAKHIKDDPALSGTIIMMLTSDNQKDNIVKTRNVGIEEYMVKPIKRSDLFNTIIKHMRKKDYASKWAIPGEDVGEPKEPSQAERKIRPLHILVAEDDHVNQKVAASMLKKQGHHVRFANNGKETIEMLEKGNFDIILMDVNMPEMGGYEATVNIREKEKMSGGHIPILAMTALAFEEDKKKCMDAGMDGYISKPVRSNELFKVIEKFVSISENEEKGRNDSAIFNKEKALKAVDGNEDLLKEIANVFLCDCPENMSGIKEAVNSRNGEALERSAHKLKGAVANFGAKTTFNIALNLEKLGRENKLDNAEETYVVLAKEIECLVNELRGFVED